MSSSNNEPKPGESPKVGEAAKAELPKTVPKPVKKGYTNPALQAMGIPRLRIPSRNWCIFWAVTGSLTAMYVYDRRERKKTRQAWKDRVAHLASQPMEPNQLPRKVTVYLAPSPGDYLETTMTHFKHYIKPILVAAAVDYEVRSESRQGELRALVAEEIRNKRREYLGLPSSEDEKTLEDRALRESLTEHLERNQEGGVICVGRGAYKEYMNGVHEGWLGPLEAPVEAIPAATTESDTNADMETRHMDELSCDVDESSEIVNSEPVLPASNSQDDSNTNETSSLAAIHEAESQPKQDQEKEQEEKQEEGEKEKRKPVPKPYISGQDMVEAELPAEFATLAKFDPLGAIPHEHIQGFKNIPIRMYRFFNRRQVAEEIGQATAAVVFGHTRPFDFKYDDQLLAEEEDFWPNKWKKTGLQKNSEWMREFIIDERVCSKMQVYEKGPEILEKDL